MDKFRVFSIFRSVSGEIGAVPQGTPMVFLRLAGCNLRCNYCDSPEAAGGSSESSVDMDIKDVADRLYEYAIVGARPHHLMITGGEPLLYQELLTELLPLTESVFRGIHIETNGTIAPSGSLRNAIAGMDTPVHFVVDIKTPCAVPRTSSIESYMPVKPLDTFGRTTRSAFAGLNIVFKAVVRDETDCMFAVRVRRLWSPETPLALSPIPPMTHAALWDWIESSGEDVLINLQIHKVIWPEGEAGDGV